MYFLILRMACSFCISVLNHTFLKQIHRFLIHYDKKCNKNYFLYHKNRENGHQETYINFREIITSFQELL